MKVSAYITVSVEDGPWSTAAVAFNTNDIVMKLAFGDEDDPFFVYETADPEFRTHLENIYGTIGHRALSRTVVAPGD